MIKILKPGDLTAAGRSVLAAPPELTAAVAEIIENVIKRGDAAVREYTEKWDGCAINSFEVTADEIDCAMEAAGPEFIGIMQRASRNIENFHRNQIRQGFIMSPGSGVVLGQRILPLGRVGVYIPGGTAPLASCVLMSCIPARLAGVGEIIISTPPAKNGSVDPGVLAAAKIAGADRVFKAGGAQAIAAMAFGTETIPRVDKITGAGNSYVAEAKRQVFGAVGIDMIAGPSDILVIADGNADPRLVAADMLSQCEHGADSIAVLITDSETLAGNVSAQIETQLKRLPREGIARRSVDTHGKIIITASIDEAFQISNELAPEHLEIFLDEPFSHLDKVSNAGSVFLGKHTPEAVGDYFAGPNNTLPTSGTARFSSPLSVDDFVKKSSFTYYTADALAKDGADIIGFAEKEALMAHGQSVQKRVRGENE